MLEIEVFGFWSNTK